MKTTLNAITETWAKIIGLGMSGLISISLYLSPIYPLIGLVLALILADTITGRWAAKHVATLEGKDARIEVSSRKTRDGLIPKILGYIAVILFVYILDRFMLSDLVTHFFPAFPVEYTATKVGGLILMWIEFDSIDENYYKVKGVTIKDIISSRVKKVVLVIRSIKEKKDALNK
jgi:hypothetical protein